MTGWTAGKIFALLILGSALISAQARSTPEGGAGALESPIFTIVGSIPQLLYQGCAMSDRTKIAVNHPPGVPSTPAGPQQSTPGTVCSFRTSSRDPDDDRVSYAFDWGDGTTSISETVSSAGSVALNHSWNQSGVYAVRAMATDDRGLASGWSEALSIRINAPPGSPSRPLGPDTCPPGASCLFSTYAVDPDGDQVLYIFDWGDQSLSKTNWTQSGEAGSLSHRWSRAGTYRIRAMAEDSRGGSSSWSEFAAITVNSPPGRPPAPSGPTFAFTGSTCSFAASASDPDGDRVSYVFDWGDKTHSGTGYVESGALVSLDHAWKRAGRYTITVSAVDSKGSSSPQSEPLIVTVNAPPHVPSTPSGPKSGWAQVPYRFSTLATDPDDDPLNYTFDWGDETALSTGFVPSGSSVSLEHSWNGSGTYQVRANATDTAGNRANWSDARIITISANDPPSAPRDIYGLNGGYTGIAYSCFTLAEDSDGDQVSYTFDWGDGNINCTDYVESGSVESASHTWRKSGVFSMRAMARDRKGARSEWSEPLEVVIAANDPPEAPIVPSGPTVGECERAWSYATCAKDPDGDPVKYIFDWGDGTTSWTGFDFIDSGKEAKASHRWSKPGIYRIRASAMDSKGTTSGWSRALAVEME